MDCKVGQNIQLKDKNENIIDGRIIDVLDDGIKVDLNHPLAGKSFSCELTLLEIQQS
jgi:FKBP-type peptidyl-prolyl cis-trans isomerase 2